MTFPILDIEKSSVEKYLSNMVQDSNHRFKSWEYSYTAFGNLDSYGCRKHNKEISFPTKRMVYNG